MHPFVYREARVDDIPEMQEVRHSVKENVLSDPSRVTDRDCEEYICRRGKGWVCLIENKIVGFAIADLVDENIWALFVRPEYEGKGVGKKLHGIMMHWYFSKGKDHVWLSTEPGSRAVTFYLSAGWTQTGVTATGEVKFIMSAEGWRQLCTLNG